eukprot:5159889-Lingulodinium_polyedra.AAC.1
MGSPRCQAALFAGPTLCAPVPRVSRRRALLLRGPGGRRLTRVSSSVALGGLRGGCSGGP